MAMEIILSLVNTRDANQFLPYWLMKGLLLVNKPINPIIDISAQFHKKIV
jgi:hypothetical protein